MNIEEKAKGYAEAIMRENDLSGVKPELVEAITDIIATSFSDGNFLTKALDADSEGTFGQAIESLRNGCKVARKGWNGKGMWLWLKPGVNVKAEWCHDEALKEIAVNNGGSIEALGTICIKTADNKILSGWNASQLDILACDWVLVP